MNLKKLFQSDYLFDPKPGSDFLYIVPLVAFFLLLILGSFTLENWIRKHPLRAAIEITVPHLSQRLRVFGLFGFILLWIRYENLPYLSMRFFLLLYLIALGVYLGASIYQFKIQLQNAIELEQEVKRHKKYLPKKKRRS